MTNEPSTPTPEPVDAPSIEQVSLRLRRLAQGARAMLIVQRSGWIIGGAVSAIAGAAGVDFVLRSPGWMRGTILLIGLVVLVVAIIRRVWPAIWFRPTESQIAARIERTEVGVGSGLDNLLASAVELSRDGRSLDPLGRALAAPVIQNAARRLASVNTRTVLRPGPSVLSAFVAVASVVAAMLAIGASPMWTGIALRRTLTPWADVQWPKRTVLANVVGEEVHALGTALPLRAALVRSTRSPETTSVTAHFRLIGPDGTGETRTGELISQGRTVQAIAPQADGSPGPASGTLMERLIEPALLAPARATAARSATFGAVGATDANTLEYWFTSGDDETRPVRVRLIDPPAVVSASANVRPPAYLSGALAGALRTVDLGSGSDGRAVLSEVIAGSRVSIAMRFNKALPRPSVGEFERVLGAEFAVAFREAGELATAEFAGETWTLTLPVASSFTIRASLRDQNGVASSEEAAFRVEARADQPPQATITLPARDEDVLPDAKVDVAGEARDDLGVASVSLESQVAKRPGGSSGAPLEPVGEARVIGRTEPEAAGGAPVLALTAASSISLSEMDVAPGDEIWLAALATDIYSLDGQTHPPLRSSLRRLRVISREQLVEQLFGQLESVRRQADRSQADQRKLLEQSQNTPPGDQASSQQAAISEQVQQMAQAVAEVSRKAAEADRPDKPLDRELGDVVRSAERAVDQAGDASREAQRSLGEAKRSREAKDTKATEDAERASQQSQEDTAQKLEQLSQSLDRGRDAFAQKRRTQQLLTDQQELRRQTGELSRETAGKSAEQLTPEQRAAAQRLGQEQESLARRAEELLRSLKEKAEELSQSDPAASEALKQAAQTGEQRALEQLLQQAARQIQQSQQQQAQQQQQKAEQTLSQMLQQLNESQRQRDAVLRRQLDSLVQTLESLVNRQAAELATFEARAAGDANGLSGLDAPLIQLRIATLAASEEARAVDAAAAEAPDANADTPKLADIILQGAARQASAIGALRATPVDIPMTRAGETDALGLLREALEVAKAAQEQSKDEGQRQQRAELRKAYQDALASQRALIERSTTTIDAPADRRQRAAARAIADEQDALATTLADLKRANQEITDSPVFNLAHEIIDASSARAASSLRETTIGRVAIISLQSVEQTLIALVAALDDADKPDEFREQEQGEQQGNQPGQQSPPPLLPPLTQLKALRELQAGALRFTKQAEASGADASVAKELTEQAARVQKRLSEEAQRVIDELNKKQGGGE